MTSTVGEGTLDQRVLRFIQKQHLVSGGQKLVVAVSGGPDSVCLLYILVKLKDILDITLQVAHLDHQLRGTESKADARYVAELANRLGIPATVEKRDVKSYQAQHHTSLEEAAREVRYEFLAKVARKVGAERVAVGHTVDDHVETILMHLIRGSGTRGLKGLQPLSRWPSSDDCLEVIRPLLELSREETVAYCRYHQLNPRTDTSNLSPLPMRNRIRHHLLPQLRSYNPQVNEALLRTARIATDDLDFIDKEIAYLWGGVARKEGNTIVLDRKSFAALPSALKHHLLLSSIEALAFSLKDIEARHIEEVMEALDKPAGKKISLPDGLNFTIEYDRYLLSTESAALCPFPAMNTEVKLNIPGKTVVPGWEVEAVIADSSEAVGEGDKNDSFAARLAFDKAGCDLTVRCRQPGDRFQPLGMSQLKKLNAFMVDAKIPQVWRKRVPIVSSSAQIIWVVGWRIDERVKVSPDTRKVLLLEFKHRGGGK